MVNNTGSEKGVSHSVDISVFFILSRSIIIVLYACVGIVGNGFVLWFYGKNKKLTGQVYILALAVIDVICCVIMPPQVTILELTKDNFCDICFHAKRTGESQNGLLHWCKSHDGARPVHRRVLAVPTRATATKAQPRHAGHGSANCHDVMCFIAILGTVWCCD